MRRLVVVGAAKGRLIWIESEGRLLRMGLWCVLGKHKDFFGPSVEHVVTLEMSDLGVGQE